MAKDVPPRLSRSKEADRLRSVARAVERDLRIAEFRSRVFEEFGEMLRESERLRFSHFFFECIGDWYVSWLLLYVRRQVDRRPNNISLVGLLMSVREAIADGVHLSARSAMLSDDEIRRDIRDLRSSAARIETYATKRIAHSEASLFPNPPTRFEVYPILEQFGNILEKYLNVIFGSARKHLRIEYDPVWTDILFRFGWNQALPFDERTAASRDVHLHYVDDPTEPPFRHYTETEVWVRFPEVLTSQRLVENDEVSTGEQESTTSRHE